MHPSPRLFRYINPKPEDDMSEGDPEEDMEADDVPSYVPDPKEETDDDDEFDDCL